MGVARAADGTDRHLTANHLGPYLLTRLLLPYMAVGAVGAVGAEGGSPGSPGAGAAAAARQQQQGGSGLTPGEGGGAAAVETGGSCGGGGGGRQDGGGVRALWRGPRIVNVASRAHFGGSVQVEVDKGEIKDTAHHWWVGEWRLGVVLGPGWRLCNAPMLGRVGTRAHVLRLKMGEQRQGGKALWWGHHAVRVQCGGSVQVEVDKGEVKDTAHHWWVGEGRLGALGGEPRIAC